MVVAWWCIYVHVELSTDPRRTTREWHFIIQSASLLFGLAPYQVTQKPKFPFPLFNDQPFRNYTDFSTTALNINFKQKHPKSPNVLSGSKTK